MITLAVNGKQYKTYESISFDKSLDTISGHFSFSFVQTDSAALPFKVDDICEIYLDSTKLLRGRIEVINGSGSADGTKIIVSGRSTLADIIDSTIGGNIEFKAPISLLDVAKQTLSKMGITGINVINNVSGLADFSSSDLISAKVGKSVFDFLEGYARKRQVLISSDNVNTIIFTRASKQVDNTPIIHKWANNSNNVISYTFSNDITKRFNKYTFWSQGNPTTDDSGTNVTVLTSTSSIATNAIDNSIHTNRIYNQLSEQSTDQSGVNDRARWELNIRKARSFSYSPKVQGLYNQDSKPWDINRLIKVSDDMAGIDSSMLINSISFEVSSQGTFTTLTLVSPDAYTLPPEGSSPKNKNKNRIIVKTDPNPK